MALKSDRGAVVVQVAVSLLALLALSSFVIDHGVMMTARAQAQNGADAGALAGAQSLVLLQGDNHAREVASKVTQGHLVLADYVAPGNITVTVPLACPPPWNTPSGCVKVDITKQDLPTFFAKLVNINTQGVRATATAMAGAGNSIQCIKPWIVADKWTDNSNPGGSDPTGWDRDDIFTPGVDTYAAPGFSATGPGNDYGLQLGLKGDRNQWSGGWSLEIELGGGNGSNTYRHEIAGCPTWVPTVGIYNPANPCDSRDDMNLPGGCLNVRQGVRQGPTEQGVRALIALDPSATWVTNEVQGGCMATHTCSNPTGTNVSPRIAPIAVFDTAAFAASGCSGNNCMAKVVNLLGFFIEGMCDDVFGGNTPTWCGSHPKEVVVGRLMNYPAQRSSLAGNAGPASFLRTTILVR